MARILIVDDDEPVLMTLDVLLRSEGHEVRPVREASEAFDVLWSSQPYDLLITDLRMAPVDGFELIRVSREVRPEMPILVVSAYLDDGTVEKIESLGCAGYVRKPFTVEDILGALRKVLASGETGGP